MYKQEQREKKPPRLAMWGMISTGAAIVLILLLTPWNFVPVQVTEDVTVIASMEYGCVGESQHGVSVIVPECSAQIGDIVSATFYVPSMELNGYYDKVQDRVMAVQP